MNKKIIILLLMILIGQTFARANQIESESSYPDFKIVAKSYFNNIIPMNRKYTLIEHNKNGFVFYKMETKVVDGIPCYFPFLDENGNQVPISLDDKEYMANVSNVLSSWLCGYIESDDGLEKIVIMFYANGSVDKEWDICAAEYSKLPVNPEDIVIKNGTFPKSRIDGIESHSTGSIYFIDDDCNYESLEFDNGQYNIMNKTLNPDIDDNKKYYGLADVLSYHYSRPPGFLYLQQNNKIYYLNGLEKNWDIKPEIKEGNLAVELSIIDSLNALRESINGRDAYRIVKADKTGHWPITVTDITITIGEKKAIVDGQEYELSIAPYYCYNEKRNRKVMIPLRDLCYLLNNKLHWRPIDDSALIERFMQIYPREPLPKK
jgi:hypothetical protein